MDHLKYFLGTGFYSGSLPKAPGTFGSLAVTVLVFGLIQAQIPGAILILLILSALISLWVSAYFEDNFGKDPGRLVMDEWAGQSLVFVGISFSGDLQTDLTLLAAGFLLFRFFDILKPLGINKVQDIGKKWGILADDLLAGFYALICLKSLIFVGPSIFGMV